MKNARSILKVPQDIALRQKMRREAASLASGEDLVPPLAFDKLGDLAEKLTARLGIGEEYLNFARILVGNESWRTTVAATPFNRRLLLLPQCLKDNELCEGSFDDLGLICAGCRGCMINDLLNEAEALGYSTLVAEGTTVAVGLVEEGSIDAVIGVSCMPVLQRSFDHVTRAAVPVIGLPLMFDGCTNTNIDTHWLQEEIRSFRINENFRPLSVSLINATVREYFTEKSLANYFGSSGEMGKQAMEVIAIGGQRMRPLMTALCYIAYSTSVDDNILRDLCMVIECFHKASLVHDDIEDNSDTRYDTATLHREKGIASAINTGDFLIGMGYRLVAGLNLEAAAVARCLQVVSSSHVAMACGQASDLLMGEEMDSLVPDKAYDIFRQKTSEAVKVAILLGAIAGGASETDLNILSDFSDEFGIAYQVRDDLNEYREEHAGEKILDYPFLLALWNEHRSDSGFVPLAGMEVSQFRQLAVQHGIEEKAAAILEERTGNCRRLLDGLTNKRLRLSLLGIMGKVFRNTSLEVLHG